MLEAHYTSADDIYSAMKVGCGYPMGPFEQLGVVGNDVSLAIEREQYLEFREPGSHRRRCWSTWSLPGSWAARPARAPRLHLRLADDQADVVVTGAELPA